MDVWNLCADQIRTLKGKLGFKNEGSLDFLAYRLDLDSGCVFDKPNDKYAVNPETLYVLLSHYAKNDPIERAGRLIKFRDLPGGHAYEVAFMKRAVHPIAEIFGSKPEKLVRAAEPLNGTEMNYGDSSVEIQALPKIPLTYTLWRGSEESPASSTILFDESASNYLPTEDLAVLGEITTIRLKVSLERFACR